jgi:hypothetical protein
MTTAHQHFVTIGCALQDAEQGQLFGKPCFKIKGKAFICFFRDCMVFKLGVTERAAALQTKGAVLFDPSGKGRPMKEWVQVPFTHNGYWERLANEAWLYVKN